MKSVIILWSLSILLVLVQEISSASPRAIAPSRINYGGSANNKYRPPSKQGEDYDDKKNSPFFPGNAMMLFQLKTSITSSLHKIEDDEESLERIGEEIKLLKGLVNALFSFFKDAVEGLITKCVIFGDNTFPNPIKIGDRCYTISNTNTGSTPDASYANARQKCLAHGGDLATPSLLPGSSFGVDLEEYLEEALESGEITSAGTAGNYWIDGRGTGQIVTDYGFEISNTFSRYISMSINPFAPADTTVLSGLTLVGPILANEVNWYIDAKPIAGPLPYICEFPTVFDLESFSADLGYSLYRTVKSSLLQDFLRKVKLIHKKKLATRKSLVDAANLKREGVKTEVINKKPQNVKVIAKVENEKKSAQLELDLGAKTTEVVKKVVNTKSDEMPTASMKDEISETEKTQQKEEMKVVEELPIEENAGIVKDEDAVVEGAKNVNEKTLLLEDILGKLEQLESFRALKQ